MLKEFREFAMRGNVIDLAVGVVIGAAFGKIVDSLVKDILMPPIGMLVGKVDFTNLFLVLNEGTIPGPYATLADAQKAGAVTLNPGLFLNQLISFIIIPPAGSILFAALNMYFYYFIGTALESKWGARRFLLYFIIGVVGAILAAVISGIGTNHFLLMSMFFAFAILYPENDLLLFFCPCHSHFLKNLLHAFIDFLRR